MIYQLLAQVLPESDPGLPGLPSQDAPLDLNDSAQCFFHTLIMGPVQMINYILNGLIDMLTMFLPKTPDEYKVGFILGRIANEHPLVWTLSGEIFSTIAPMILIIIFVKAWKIFSPL